MADGNTPMPGQTTFSASQERAMRQGNRMARRPQYVPPISSPRTGKPVGSDKYEAAWGKGEMPADDATDEQ